MKQNFAQCLRWLLHHEGGFVDHPDDPGGMTNKGITAKTYQRWLSETIDEDAVVTEEIRSKRLLLDFSEHTTKQTQNKLNDHESICHGVPPSDHFIDSKLFVFCENKSVFMTKI